MKKFSIVLLSVFATLTSCKDENTIQQVSPIPQNKNYEVAPKPKYDFQDTHCQVFFGNSGVEIERTKRFLVKNGLSSRVHHIPETANWRRLDSLYMTKDFSTMTSEEKNLFDQVISISILRNHALLNEKNEKAKIAFYTDKFVSASGKGAGLLYHCINALGNDLDESKKQSYIKSTISNSQSRINEIKKYIPYLIEKFRKSNTAYDSVRILQQENIKQKVQREEEYVEKLEKMIVND